MKIRKPAAALALVLLCALLISCSAPDGVSRERETENESISISGMDAAGYAYSAEEYFAVNMYLSNFTEIGLLRTKGYDFSSSSEADIFDIGVKHCVFNYSGSIESGSYSLAPSEGFAVRRANSRIKAGILLNAIERLLKKQPSPKDMENLFYDDTSEDGAYFYWTRKDEPVPGGFSLLTKIEPMGGSRYSIIFNLYNSRGEPMDVTDKKYYRYTKEDALSEFPQGVVSNISAIIEAEDLSDVSTMKLILLPKINLS